MKNRFLPIILMTLVLWAAMATFAYAEIELDDGKYYTIVDEKGKAIDYTGLKVSVGDEYISPDNSRYRVDRVAGLTAYAKNMGKVKLVARPVNYASLKGESGINLVAEKGKKVVGVYSTHDDESYTPTDGQDSIRGKGGIIKVADSLTQKLDSTGLKVIHDTTPHDPHDANAYNRSRKTASKLMRQGAFSLIDVHRDAAPAKAYATDVAGKNVTKIKLVVGRSNPKMAANMQFAKNMKAHIDKNHPGLSAGIFVGHGNYNQDLSSQAMLIEVGADKNDRKAAQQAVSLFAESVPQVLGVSTSSGTSKTSQPKGTLTATSKQNKNNYGVTIGIVAALAILLGAFFMLNKGKVK